MHPTAAVSPQAAAVSRLLLLADDPRRAAAPSGRAGARVRRYRLARLRLEEDVPAARHAHLRAAYD
jgi:hypothetical protein